MDAVTTVAPTDGPETGVSNAEPPADLSAAAPILDVTPAAMEVVLGIRAEEEDPESVGLRVEITGAKGPEFIYDLALDPLADSVESDARYRIGELEVIIPAASVLRLTGSVLDTPRSNGQGGLVIRNPNRPNPTAGVDLELTGDVAERVTQLLEQSINPSLAMHGGFATLVGVDDDNNVYVTMGGGCQGCAMSLATLTEGIQVAIKEAIPEVDRVIDATDHSQGENPFY